MTDNLTAKQNDYAVFLPALSSFYSTYVGKQRFDQYVDQNRIPKHLQGTALEAMNWLSDKGVFQYKWSLYSAGHADLDVTRHSPKDDMVRDTKGMNRPDNILVGDSGGFQIAKGVWQGDWRAGATCTNADKKRKQVLTWLDSYFDYSMGLDIPSWVVHDEKASRNSCITQVHEAVEATKFNNEYFIANRKGKENGGTKFLNVLQGDNHQNAHEWYDQVKHYCDDTQYPTNHFDGWGMGGQNMCDIHLILERIVHLHYDGLLQSGKHDWMHFLGTSKLEWATLLTDVQRAVRANYNPTLTISFDCASPFLATANGQVYTHVVTPHDQKWVYRMNPTADNKKYFNDTRLYRDGVTTDAIHEVWEDSPISEHMRMMDICHYGPGMLNKIGKEGKTSWDSFSYALLMGHNVWTHINAVQEANRQYDQGVMPGMLWSNTERFRDIVHAVFSAPTKEKSLDIIAQHSIYFMDIIGTRGFKGKKTQNATTQFNNLFTEV